MGSTNEQRSLVATGSELGQRLQDFWLDSLQTNQMKERLVGIQEHLITAAQIYKSFAGNNKNQVFGYLSVFQSHSLIK